MTNAAGVQGLSGPNPFTISDLSYVWIICDVYENDLDAVHVGEYADIRLNAYPNKVFKGRIDNILPILDPSIRTAKVRIEVAESRADAHRNVRHGDLLRQAAGDARRRSRHGNPASARPRLGLPPLGTGHFKRLEVVAGSMLPGNMQEIVSGVKPGDQVVKNALALQNTVEQ